MHHHLVVLPAGLDNLDTRNHRDRVPIHCVNGSLARARSIAKKNVARFRENNAGADYAPPHSAKRACTRPRSIERYRRVHAVTLW